MMAMESQRLEIDPDIGIGDYCRILYIDSHADNKPVLNVDLCKLPPLRRKQAWALLQEKFPEMARTISQINDELAIPGAPRPIEQLLIPLHYLVSIDKREVSAVDIETCTSA